MGDNADDLLSGNQQAAPGDAAQAVLLPLAQLPAPPAPDDNDLRASNVETMKAARQALLEASGQQSARAARFRTHLAPPICLQMRAHDVQTAEYVGIRTTSSTTSPQVRAKYLRVPQQTEEAVQRRAYLCVQRLLQTCPSNRITKQMIRALKQMLRTGKQDPILKLFEEIRRGNLEYLAKYMRDTPAAGGPAEDIDGLWTNVSRRVGCAL